MFAAAGSVDHNALVGMVKSAFASAGALGPDTPRSEGRYVDCGRSATLPGSTVVVERPAEQTTFVHGCAVLRAQPPAAGSPWAC